MDILNFFFLLFICIFSTSSYIYNTELNRNLKNKYCSIKYKYNVTIAGICLNNHCEKNMNIYGNSINTNCTANHFRNCIFIKNFRTYETGMCISTMCITEKYISSNIRECQIKSIKF